MLNVRVGGSTALLLWRTYRASRALVYRASNGPTMMPAARKKLWIKISSVPCLSVDPLSLAMLCALITQYPSPVGASISRRNAPEVGDKDGLSDTLLLYNYSKVLKMTGLGYREPITSNHRLPRRQPDHGLRRCGLDGVVGIIGDLARWTYTREGWTGRLRIYLQGQSRHFVGQTIE